MIITFCGHAQFYKSEDYEKILLKLLEELIGNNAADFYLGGYGDFDKFAYSCCKKYKFSHPNVSLVFITPYLTLEYQKKHLDYIETMYDSVIYPQIENKPLRLAIIYRNRYMIESADYIIAYVDHDYGGAYKAYKHAIKKGKIVFNLVDM